MECSYLAVKAFGYENGICTAQRCWARVGSWASADFNRVLQSTFSTVCTCLQAIQPKA